jgi:hypothetical protein
LALQAHGNGFIWRLRQKTRLRTITALSAIGFALFTNPLHGQQCALEILFDDKTEIEVLAIILDFGKAVEYELKEANGAQMSGTAYSILIDTCEWYLPVVAQYNNSKYQAGELLKFVLSHVTYKNGSKIYYIKEIHFLDGSLISE